MDIFFWKGDQIGNIVDCNVCVYRSKKEKNEILEAKKEPDANIKKKKVKTVKKTSENTTKKKEIADKKEETGVKKKKRKKIDKGIMARRKLDR